MIEDLAVKLVLAHPKTLRVIAESSRKTDQIDAEVLALFLALDMIPQSHRLRSRCPRGFAPFADEVEERIRPLFQE